MDYKKLRNLQHVRRFNFHHCNHYQSVAEHSYFTAMLTIAIMEAMGWGTEARMLGVGLALLHDASEAVTGDVPFLVKRKLGKVAEDLDKEAFKELGLMDPMVGMESGIQEAVDLADKLEAKLYLQEERRSGNTVLARIEKEIWTLIMHHSMLAQRPQILDLMGRLGIEMVERAELPEEMSH